MVVVRRSRATFLLVSFGKVRLSTFFGRAASSALASCVDQVLLFCSRAPDACGRHGRRVTQTHETRRWEHLGQARVRRARRAGAIRRTGKTRRILRQRHFFFLVMSCYLKIITRKLTVACMACSVDAFLLPHSPYAPLILTPSAPSTIFIVRMNYTSICQYVE